MKTIEQVYTIAAPVAAVWQALIDPQEIEGWGGGTAVMDDKVGTQFSLWDGSIWGTNTEVISEKKLVQDWYDNEALKEPTIVTFTLTPDDKGTIVHLLHTNIPDESFKPIEEGWKLYYLGPLQEYVESKT